MPTEYQKRSNSSSSLDTDYYDKSQDSPQPFTHHSRKDLKGRILEIFEESENEYIRGREKSDFESENRDLVTGLGRNSEMDDIFNTFSKLDQQKESEEDKQN